MNILGCISLFGYPLFVDSTVFLKVVINTLNVFVGALKPSDTDARSFIGIEKVDAEKDVSYWIRNMLDFQRQGVIFLHGQQLKRQQDR